MTVPVVALSLMEQISLVVELLVIVGAASMSWISFQLWQEVQERGEAAMSSFQLHPAKTVNEFEYLFGSSIFLLVGAAFYLSGGITANMWLVFTGLALQTVFIGSTAYVVYRWWRRF
jgi:threonine/homoserine/homoserine lactone efflux protein